MQTINCNIVSGEMLQMLCDIYIGEDSDFAYNPLIQEQKEKCLNISFIPEHFNNPRKVFVYTNCIKDFFNKHIHKFQNKFVLVSHNSDCNIDESYNKFTDNPKIIHWFTQNLNTRHPKLSMIPIGVANTRWNHGKRELFQNLPKIEFSKKENLLYFEFSVDTNYSKRLPCRDILSKYFTFGNRVSSTEYLNKITNSKFVISPEGNGIDCHRIWETLLVGSVPIVSRSIFTEELEKEFPILIINSWEEVTPEFLELNINKFTNRIWPNEKLDFEYYKNKIQKNIEFNKYSEQDINHIYWTKVKKDSSYFSKYELLPPCPVKAWEYSWKNYDFPRTWCILDFKEWIAKYVGPVGLLGYTCDTDPELEFITYNEKYKLEYPTYDLHTIGDTIHNKFDFFLFNQTLEHLYNPFMAVKSISKILKPGGYVFTSVPTLNIPHSTPIHFNGFNPMGLAMLFLSCGFEIIEIGQWGNYEYISKLWKTHSWPGYEELNHNGRVTNEEANVCQCWILSRKLT